MNGRSSMQNVPLAGLWIQDWSGTNTTSAGHQVLWNWQLYTDWDQIVAKERLKTSLLERDTLWCRSICS
jgi:hypothetical protein